MSNKEKAERYYMAHKTNHRVVKTIELLLDGEKPIMISKALGVSRQAVTKVRAKYLPKSK